MIQHHRLKENLYAWVCDPISPHVMLQADRLSRLADAFRIVLMPDVHLGHHVPNGCVLATHKRIYPEAIGRDIGCGLSAIQFQIQCDTLPRNTLASILENLNQSIRSLKQSKKSAVEFLPETCQADQLSNGALKRIAEREGKLQLGTLGRGNHFLELGRDQAGLLWAIVHSGSRSMGQAICDWHLGHSRKPKKLIHSQESLPGLELDSEHGRAYLADMQWAVRYARENRLLILNRIADLIEKLVQAWVIESSYMDTPHNFGRIEEHFGQRLIIHRKSVNSASQGELGVIAGSMASGCRIVMGRGNIDSLRSSSHGAGRTMSRGEALEKLKVKELRGLMGPVVYSHDKLDLLLDESPAAYRNLAAVMKAQKDLVVTKDTLKPILNFKAFGPGPRS